MKKTILTIALLASMCMAHTWAAGIGGGDITEEEVAQTTIAVSGSTVRVTNAAGQKLEVYDVAGVCVATLRIDSDDITFHLNLSRGCYILKVGKVARKVAIR
ncbi:MAG: T9SS type A sorting domain-containing protein [Bacteroidaceae bacterium]|nr:T9SS type A sorting domain-containing protein [Bacteroidaceae bacterium]